MSVYSYSHTYKQFGIQIQVWKKSRGIWLLTYPRCESEYLARGGVLPNHSCDLWLKDRADGVFLSPPNFEDTPQLELPRFIFETSMSGVQKSHGICPPVS